MDKYIVGNLYGVKIYADKDVEPQTIEIRDDETCVTRPMIYDLLKIVDAKNWKNMFKTAGIKVIDKRKV